jgi:rhamnogalacturonan endolyase
MHSPFPRGLFLALYLSFSLPFSLALLNVTETSERVTVSNSRLTFSLNKSSGLIDKLTLDIRDLLGDKIYETPTPGGPTGNGVSGVGPYLDCYCVNEGNGAYTPGRNARIRVIRGRESGQDGVTYAGVVMTDTNPISGQVMEHYTFMRDGETGLHTFSRVAYTKPRGGTRSQLQEFRTLFRPNTRLWTHLVTNNWTVASIPKKETLKAARMAQDATYDVSPFKDDAYVRDTADFF